MAHEMVWASRILSVDDLCPKPSSLPCAADAHLRRGRLCAAPPDILTGMGFGAVQAAGSLMAHHPISQLQTRRLLRLRTLVFLRPRVSPFVGTPRPPRTNTIEILAAIFKRRGT
jgi:hypothetical protein